MPLNWVMIKWPVILFEDGLPCAMRFGLVRED